jgi:hypothetical protein
MAGFGISLAHAQTINTSCTLYPGAAYCTSTSSDGGAAAAQARQQQYETGQAIGNSIGMAIFRAHFPGWRRKYCSTHPAQPFYYGNANGDSITGTCPTLQGLANEAAGEFIGKHRSAVTSAEQAVAVDKYIADNHLPDWQPKSYEKAAKAVPVATGKASQQATENPQQPAQSPQQAAQTHVLQVVLGWPASQQPAQGPQQAAQTPQQSSSSRDLFVWFDEPFPVTGAPLFEVLVTGRAYDGALAILRQARHGNTSVQAGTSTLDTDYHPATTSLASWNKSNPNSAPTLFYWQGEDISDTTAVMHFRMTKRAYEQMLALMAGSDLRARPPQASN